jgi:pyruvate formate lyase activating enzyme
MRCLWCSNPEAISPGQQLGVYPEKCQGLEKCGLCMRVCPGRDLIEHDGSGPVARVNMGELCKDCLRCAEVCPGRAIRLWGEKMTVPQLMKIIEEDRSLYDRTGGGVTLSGGEVLVQWEFAQMLCGACASAGINVCVESALNCPEEHMRAVLSTADLVITDIKHMDPDVHRSLTGSGNERILSNIKCLHAMGKKPVIRTPVVVGYNADEGNIRSTSRFIAEELHGEILAWQLLPFKKLGTKKYASLGLEYPMSDYTPPERTEWEPMIMRYVDMIRNEYGLPAFAGSSDIINV